jgi:hypothetical protein
MQAIVDYIKSPLKILSTWYIDAPQVRFDAVMREYRRVKEYLYGDTDIICRKDFEIILQAMFPAVEGDLRGNEFRKTIWSELEGKMNEWSSSLS